MLKDVGMTVPKIRETSAVYMQQDRGIYAATQGMKACNNTNMCNPTMKDVGRSYALLPYGVISICTCTLYRMCIFLNMYMYCTYPVS